MELEPKEPSKLFRWLLILAGLVLLYALGMAPLMAVADSRAADSRPADRRIGASPCEEKR